MEFAGDTMVSLDDMIMAIDRRPPSPGHIAKQSKQRRGKRVGSRFLIDSRPCFVWDATRFRQSCSQNELRFLYPPRLPLPNRPLIVVAVILIVVATVVVTVVVIAEI